MKKDNQYEAIIAKIREEFEQSENTFVRIAILGRSGTGKSTFMNALANKKLSATGGISEVSGVNKDGTKSKRFKPVEYRAENLCFYDLPGYGTENFPTDQFLKEFDIENQYDCVLLMTADRFFKDDRTVYTNLTKKKIPVFVVRTKFDQTLVNAEHDDLPTQPSALMDLIKGRIAEEIGSERSNVFVISSRERHQWEFARLKDAIELALPAIKKDKFIENVYIQTEADLAKKRAVAEKQVKWMGVLAAANAVNPVPGLDISLDIGVMFTLAHKIAKIYGLEEENLSFRGKAISAEFRLEIAQRLTGYLTKEGIVVILKKMGSKVVAKNLAKWLPGIGHLISAGLGFGVTFTFGQSVVKDCEELARKMIHYHVSAA